MSTPRGCNCFACWIYRSETNSPVSERIPHRGYYRGWRVWRTEDLMIGPGTWWIKNQKPQTLYSYFFNYEWNPGVNVCGKRADLTKDGDGGFYVNSSFDNVMFQLQNDLKSDTQNYLSNGVVALGTTVCYGKGVIASMGGRFEKTIPEYIVATGVFETDRNLDEIAMKYGMKLVSMETAQRKQTGIIHTPIPDWLGRPL